MNTRTETALPIRKRVHAMVKWLERDEVRGSVIVDVTYAWQAIDALKAEGMVPDDDFVIEVRREPSL